MASKPDPDVDKTARHVHEHDDSPSPEFEHGVVQDENTYAFTEDRKLGVTGAVFLILNKMIGTGIFSTPSGIFAATGSVGVSLFLWVIGMIEPLHIVSCKILTLR